MRSACSADAPLNVVDDEHRAHLAAVRFFMWDLWAALNCLRTHVPNEQGSCLGCHTQLRSTPYPCVVVTLAEMALEATGLAETL